MTLNPRNSYIGALAAQARAEAYPWTAWRAHLGNVLPYYTEMREQYHLPAGPKTWRLACVACYDEFRAIDQKLLSYAY